MCERGLYVSIMQNTQKTKDKRPDPIIVHGVMVEYQGEVQINTRGKNILPGTFEMYNTRDKNKSVLSMADDMGHIILALTSHAVSVRIW